MQQSQDTRARLLDAAEKVIREARGSVDISVRRIAAEAGANVAAVSYHFGSMEKLGVATAERVYRRLNRQRLTELQQAADRAAPHPPPLEEILAALIGTSIRWSLDPASPYAVLLYLNRLALLSDHPETFDSIVHAVDHHRIFASYLQRAAPWLDDNEIAWRLTAALGVRSQITRHPGRCEVLTGEPLAAADPDRVIARICDILLPMFARPARGHPQAASARLPRLRPSNSV